MASTPSLPEASTAASTLPSRPNVKRHLAAAALSAIVPGAGQLFLRRKKRAAVLLFGLIAVGIGFWPARLPRTYPGLILLMWMLLLVTLFGVFDALLSQDARLPGRMSRWWIAAGILLLYIGFNVTFTSLLFGSGFNPMKNASSSMAPTIKLGDKFVVDNRYYQHHPPRRLDLIIFRRPNELFVKRVIAVGGDTIEGKQHKIFLNGQPQDEPFTQHSSEPGSEPDPGIFGPVKVPDGKYFVMGDRPDISLDSREPEFGLVDASSIVGRPIYGYQLSREPLWWPLR